MDHEMLIPAASLVNANLPDDLLSDLTKLSGVSTSITFKMLENFGVITTRGAETFDNGCSYILSKKFFSDDKDEHIAFVEQFLADLRVRYETEETQMLSEALRVHEDIIGHFEDAVAKLKDDILPCIERMNYKVYINIKSEFIDNRFVVIKVKGV